MRDSFIFYRSFFEAIEERDEDGEFILSDKEQLRMYRALCRYALNETEPELKGVKQIIFSMAKPQIDANTKKYENGKKGGRPKNTDNLSDSNRLEGLKPVVKTTEKPNDNLNSNVNANQKENASIGVDVWSLSRSVLGYLNSSTGSSFRLDDVDSVRLISDLSHKGYTEADMKSVIDKKVADWLGDPKVEQYLRPSTLFGPKFEQYLNQPSTAANEARQKQQAQQDAKARNEEKRQAYAKELEMVQDRIRTASVSERIELTGRKAWLEDEIGRLTS